jgi:hypothetical protein
MKRREFITLLGCGAGPHRIDTKEGRTLETFFVSRHP